MPLLVLTRTHPFSSCRQAEETVRGDMDQLTRQARNARGACTRLAEHLTALALLERDDALVGIDVGAHHLLHPSRRQGPGRGGLGGVSLSNGLDPL
jgi:hypothetical protein